MCSSDLLFVRFVSNCSIFKEPASRRRPLYYHLLPYLVNTFFLLFFLFFFTTFLHYFLFGIFLLGLSLWLYRFSCRSFDRQRCLSYFFLHLLSIPFLHFLYSFFYFFQFNVVSAIYLAIFAFLPTDNTRFLLTMCKLQNITE